MRGFAFGAIAQLGEHLHGMQGVSGSIPLTSTNSLSNPINTEHWSLDVNYQYVNLGAFKGGTDFYNNGVFSNSLQRGINGGDIKTQELMVGLQYTFK